MPTAARAIVATAIDTVEVRSFAVRDAGPGEVLIATEVSCVSPGTELRCLAGKQDASAFPFVPGYSLAGRVIQAGAGTGVAVGTRVFASGSGELGGATRMWGGHVSLALVPAGDVIAVPDNVDATVASLTHIAAIPLHGVGLSRPTVGERVAVIGLGVIGLQSAIFHRAAGADVVVCDRSPERVARAASLGLRAVQVRGTLVETFADVFPGGADIVVDATGVPRVIAEAIAVAKDTPWSDRHSPRPRYLVQGSYAADFSVPYTAAFMKELSFLLPRDCHADDNRTVLGMLGRGAVDLAPMISAVRPPEDAMAVYAELRKPDTPWITAAFRWA